jgi:hypothetical protein
MYKINIYACSDYRLIWSVSNCDGFASILITTDFERIPKMFEMLNKQMYLWALLSFTSIDSFRRLIRMVGAVIILAQLVGAVARLAVCVHSSLCGLLFVRERDGRSCRAPGPTREASRDRSGPALQVGGEEAAVEGDPTVVDVDVTTRSSATGCSAAARGHECAAMRSVAVRQRTQVDANSGGLLSIDVSRTDGRRTC